MDEIIYEALSSYYATLGNLGYLPANQAKKLLVLCFYRDFVFNDYRGLISAEDYKLIEQALDCIFGSTCLIPYPDYLKMGKLHLGEITELATRINTVEGALSTKVIKSKQNIKQIGDIDFSNVDIDPNISIDIPTNQNTTPSGNQNNQGSQGNQNNSGSQGGQNNQGSNTDTSSGPKLMYYGNAANVLSTGEQVVNTLQGTTSLTVNNVEYNHEYFYIAVRSPYTLASVFNNTIESVTENFTLVKGNLSITVNGDTETYALYECSLNSEYEESDMGTYYLTITLRS